MRIAVAVGERVVLPVHGYPLLASLPGGEPQHDAEEHIGDGVQRQRAVGEAPTQVDRGGEIRSLRQQDGDDRDEQSCQQGCLPLCVCELMAIRGAGANSSQPCR